MTENAYPLYCKNIMKTPTMWRC